MAIETSSAHSADPASLSSADRDEWLIDQSLQETFPASDPISPSRPGSLIGLRNAEAQRRREPAWGDMLKGALPWLVAAAGIVAWRAFGRRRS